MLKTWSITDHLVSFFFINVGLLMIICQFFNKYWSINDYLSIFLSLVKPCNRLSHSAVAIDLGHPYWIPTHGMHQWLLLQFLVLLMMDAESVRNM